MSHTIREKQKLLNRVRRIKGQLDAVERALEAEAGCAEVMHLIAAARGAVNGLMGEVVEDHIRTHLIDRDHAGGGRGDEDLVELFHSYFK